MLTQIKILIHMIIGDKKNYLKNVLYTLEVTLITRTVNEKCTSYPSF